MKQRKRVTKRRKIASLRASADEGKRRDLLAELFAKSANEWGTFTFLSQRG